MIQLVQVIIYCQTLLVCDVSDILKKNLTDYSLILAPVIMSKWVGERDVLADKMDKDKSKVKLVKTIINWQ